MDVIVRFVIICTLELLVFLDIIDSNDLLIVYCSEILSFLV